LSFLELVDHSLDDPALAQEVHGFARCRVGRPRREVPADMKPLHRTTRGRGSLLMPRCAGRKEDGSPCERIVGASQPIATPTTSNAPRSAAATPRGVDRARPTRR
jgi:hypothetical protein